MPKYIALLRNLKRHLVFKKAFMSIWVHHWATDTSGSQFNFYFETGPCLCSSDQVQTCDSPCLSLLRTRMACPAYRFFFSWFKHCIYYCVRVYMCGHRLHSVCVEVRGQLCEVASLIPLYLGPREQTQAVRLGDRRLLCWAISSTVPTLS